MGPKGYPGNRDGLVNLYRLPSDQLSFLQQYVEKLNTEMERQMEKLVKDWKASIQQAEKEKFGKEMKRNEEQMKLLNLKRQYLKEKRQDGENSTEKQNQGTRKTVTRNRDRYGSRYEYDSDGTVREVPEPIVYPPRSRYPPPRPYHGSAPSPAAFETPWTIEEVELTFIPDKLSLVATDPMSQGLQSYRMAEPSDESRRDVKLEVATNTIAPESFSSFAVVLSRCQGVERPRDIITPHQREYSPGRTYSSGFTSQYEEEEEEEWAESVEKIDHQRAGPVPMGYPPPPPLPDVVKEQKGAEAPSETGKDEDAFETESKAGEEGEDCGEGTVYISVVKKAE